MAMNLERSQGGRQRTSQSYTVHQLPMWLHPTPQGSYIWPLCSWASDLRMVYALPESSFSASSESGLQQRKDLAQPALLGATLTPLPLLSPSQTTSTPYLVTLSKTDG